MDYDSHLQALRKKFAVASDKVEIQAMLRKFPEIDVNVQSPDPENPDGRPLLHLAIEEEKVEVVDYLLNQAEIKADPEFIDSKTGITPLCLAIQSGSLEAVKLLIAAGADPNRPVDFMTPL